MNLHTGLKPVTVALSGATGFIGGALARALPAAGYRVRALVRNSQRVRHLQSDDVQLVPGSMTDPGAIATWLQQADAVVHCAGSVRGGPLQDFLPANLHGTELICRQLRERQPGTPLLQLSSLAAREPQLSHYAHSKRLGEQALEASGDTLLWSILRPPAVYGPGDQELLPLFRLMRRGFAPLPGKPGNRFALVHIDDVVAAIIAWLGYAGDRARLRHTYTLSDTRPQGYDWHDVATAMARIRGGKVRLLPIPAPILDAAAGLNQLGARLLGYAPMLTRGKLRELRHPDWVCDHSALTRDLDWHARVDLDTGLRSLFPGPGECPTPGRQDDGSHRG